MIRSKSAMTFSESYRQLLGRDATRAELRRARRRLKDGSSFGEQVLVLARSDEHRARVRDEVGTCAGAPDPEFVAHAYREVLQRPPDTMGTAYFLEQLESGMNREQVLDVLASSDEHVNRVAARAYPLPSLVETHPERYRFARTVDDDRDVLCYLAETESELDWISEQIAEHDYYDRPGVWGFAITEEKRTMAKVIAHFSPTTVLDLGCANGTILKCLYDMGITGEGVELSLSSINQAFPEVRDSIYHGDVASIARTREYDLVSGLDIFEHVTPRQLREMLGSIADLLAPGGVVLANVPAFGTDPIFGTIFPLYLPEWVDGAREHRTFSMIEVDEYGFPLHGHLIWAAADWWVTEFERAGFERDEKAELQIHEEHDEFLLAAAPSRRALFAFRKPGDPARP